MTVNKPMSAVFAARSRAVDSPWPSGLSQAGEYRAGRKRRRRTSLQACPSGRLNRPQVLEMFIDPNCNLWANDGKGSAYSFEVCGPLARTWGRLGQPAHL